MMHNIEEILKERILVLDGAMGTMIQQYNLTEEQYRGNRFAGCNKLQKGNNDLLTLTQPAIIKEIHKEYLAAGADIIETNTFNATSVSMEEYGMQRVVAEINREATRLAREVADEFTRWTPDKPRFVAGAVGPTNKTLSMSPRVEEPMYRDISFEQLCASYEEQIDALVEGGVDILLVETVFDTLNAKAALFAAQKVFDKQGRVVPIMLSVTLSDKAGRTLSGQTIEGFMTSVSHARLLSIGLNCSFGATEMKPHLKQLKRISPVWVSAYPNAGLPNQMGEYDETPERMAAHIEGFVKEGLVNIVGGCCGTTPAHIAKFVDIVEGVKPPTPEGRRVNMHLSGLEDFELLPRMNFVNIGERCNVAGSRKFLRLIKEKNYEEALKIAQQQVEDGAQIVDINMDDGLLDGPTEMRRFLNLLSSDPDVSRVPFMIDSSQWKTIEAGLQCVQGKAIVNSISLKNGEKEFLHQAKLIQQYGAAAVVMAFDEKGQADSYERRMEICSRAYRLLVDAGFEREDIIFDPNVLAIATGIAEHADYAKDFIESVRWIKKHCVGAKVVGGISNLSFSFRGNNYIREVMHAVFLYHAVEAGLDMGIVNPAQAVVYEEIPEELRVVVEDVLFNRHEEATERLMEHAEKLSKTAVAAQDTQQAEWRNESLEERISYSLIKGINDFLEEDLEEALQKYPHAVDIIDVPLMDGMNRVGELFGAGKLFLPQVVKAARTMKRAVSLLEPIIEKEKATAGENKTGGKILLATVKGDVHDIGKNILSVILQCNNYEIIDLGVMVTAERIMEAIRTHNPDVVGLSGLITPSLEEMGIVATEMQRAGFEIPLLIGGATTSKLHTALKIDPNYSKGTVVYVKDASQSPIVMANLMNSKSRNNYIEQIKGEYATLRSTTREKQVELVELEEARSKRYRIDWENLEVKTPRLVGRKVLQKIAVEEVIPYINWRYFFTAWEMPAQFASIKGVEKSDASREEWLLSFAESEREKALEACKLYDDAQALLERAMWDEGAWIRAVLMIGEAYSMNDTVYVNEVPFAMLRQQKKNERGVYMSLADFVVPQGVDKRDYVGAFAVTADAETMKEEYRRNDDAYSALLLQSLLDRLAEGATEWLHEKVRKEYWGYAHDEVLSVEEMFAVKYRGIRPAVGYPSIPDQSVNFDLHQLLLKTEEIGISLTENGLMLPNASVAGLIFAHEESRYFAVGPVSTEQFEDYSQRRDMEPARAKKFLAANLLSDKK